MRPDKVPDGGKSLPFDFTRAHHLYQALFGQVEDLTKGKHLLIVPSGPLTQIPFHVLVTEHPNPKATGAAAFRRAAWFAESNSITVLPAVSSLKAFREHAKASHATKSYAGLRERSTAAEWRTYTEHPFTKGMADGSLPEAALHSYCRRTMEEYR